MEALQDEPREAQLEPEPEAAGSFQIVQDLDYQERHPLCTLYRDQPPLNPQAAPPRLGGRAVVRRGQAFVVRDAGAAGAAGDFADAVVMVFLASKPGVASEARIGNPGIIQDGRIQLEVPADAPVGEYELRLVHGDRHTPLLGFIVIFNPFTCKHCPESAGRRRKLKSEFMEEYVGGDQGLLWQGLSDDYGAHVWQHDPFRAANLLIAISLLADLPLNLRSDPTAISRHLTYAIGERVCYGSLAMFPSSLLSAVLRRALGPLIWGCTITQLGLPYWGGVLIILGSYYLGIYIAGS